MPNLVHQICGLFMADVRRTLIGSPLKGNDFVRVNLSAPDPGGHLGLRILGHVGMDDDTDKNILLPMDTSGPGIAYRKREACLFLLRNGKLSLFEAEKAGSSNHASMDGRRDRFRKRLTRDDLQWFLCIPLEVEVDGRNPVYVLTVDSNIKQERCRLEEVIDTRERLSSYAGRVTERVQPLLGRLDRMRSYGER
jgi:hypothetical protein